MDISLSLQGFLAQQLPSVFAASRTSYASSVRKRPVRREDVYLKARTKKSNHGFFLACAKHLRNASNSLAHAPLLTSLPRATQHFPYAVAAGRHCPKVVASVRPATFFTPGAPPPLTGVIVCAQPVPLLDAPRMFVRVSATKRKSSKPRTAGDRAHKVLAPKRKSRCRHALLAQRLAPSAQDSI